MYGDWGVFNVDMYLVDCDSACLFQIEKKLVTVPLLLVLFTGNRLACNAGVLVGKVRVTSLQSFVQLAMFDVELKWMWERGRKRCKQSFPKVQWSRAGLISITHPSPLLSFDHHSPCWYKFLSLPSLLLLWKSKMAALIFSRKIWSIANQNCIFSTNKS